MNYKDKKNTGLRNLSNSDISTKMGKGVEEGFRFVNTHLAVSGLLLEIVNIKEKDDLSRFRLAVSRSGTGKQKRS